MIHRSMEQMGQQEMCMPRSLQLWRGITDRVGFMLQLFLQILRGTPSMVQMLLSHVGFTYPLLSTSASPFFNPLPIVEIPLQEIPSASEHHGGNTDVSDASDSDQCLEKLTVVLDLDETLVCAYETSSLPASIRAQAIEAGLKWFELECVSSDKECEGNTKISYVTVFERPGLQEFLKQIGEFADLILFTAGLEGYAKPLVDQIDTVNQFRLRLYRPSTVSTQYKDHVKDLSCLSKDLLRIVIVDNNPFSFLLQPLNGIPCVPFSAAQPYDNQLLEVILPLLKHLSLQKDVRPVLYKRFQMPQWFRQHGILTSGRKD